MELQHARSVVGVGPAGHRRMLIPDFEFSLGAAKAKVAKAMEAGGSPPPAAFLRFYEGTLFDRLLQSALLYFTAALQHDALTRCSRAAHAADTCSPGLVASRLAELAEEAASHRLALSVPYCEVLLSHSSYKHQHQDARFFECLYASLAAVLAEAFERVGGKQPAIEAELGRLFRGKHFNVAARRHGPQRSIDTLTVMQLFEVKHQASNRALNAQLISSLAEKAPSLSVQIASVSNSPLVSQAVASPFVTRSRLADPRERDALLHLPYSRSNLKPDGGSGAGSGSSLEPFSLLRPGKPAAVSPGSPAGVRARPPELQPLTPRGGGSGWAAPAGATPTTTNGPSASLAATPLPRASTVKPFARVAALPEAAGLPYDEGFAFLCLLRRSILYGPTLGLPTVERGGRSGMMSNTGALSRAATGGPLSNCSSAVFGRG